MKKYTVAHGDTLWGLALREYGDGSLFTVIAAANHLVNPDFIQAGQELLVPYVTFRHHVITTDTGTMRKQLTQTYYGTADSTTQLMWEVANGVAQREIITGSWLRIPDMGAHASHHTVVDNETLRILAERWYGDEHLATMVVAANHLPDENISTGQTLQVPGFNRRRFVTGNTLREICSEEYGPGEVDLWAGIVAAANRIADASLLTSGQLLLLPS